MIEQIHVAMSRKMGEMERFVLEAQQRLDTTNKSLAKIQREESQRLSDLLSSGWSLLNVSPLEANGIVWFVYTVFKEDDPIAKLIYDSARELREAINVETFPVDLSLVQPPQKD